MMRTKRNKSKEDQNETEKGEIMYVKCAVKVTFHIPLYILIINKNIILIIVQEEAAEDQKKKIMKVNMKKIILIRLIVLFF